VHYLVVTRSLVSINVVTLRRDRLVGERLWTTGKQPRCRTRHPGLLSLSHPSVGKRGKYQAKAGGVNKQARDALFVSVISQC